MLKNDIIVNGIYKNFLTVKKQLYVEGLDTYDKENYKEFYDDETINECFRIYQNNKKRKIYSKEELAKWFFAIYNINGYKKYKIVFGTLTFSNNTLEKTTKETRRRYVARFLHNQKSIEKYIANIDYGKNNEREHYHFIAFTRDKIDYSKWKDKIDLEAIKLDKISFKKIAKYLVKLNNHAYKESTKLERIIKDRNKDSLLDCLIELYRVEFNAFKVRNLDLKTDRK